MRVVPTALPGVLIIEPDIYRDSRGWFHETYHTERYRAAGIPDTFVQDNHSRSVQGTVRGLHLQVARPQAKLIRVVQGEIFDVVVDVRRGSPTFGKWLGVLLTGELANQCYVPCGFAHGFSVLSPTADVVYKCTAFYDKASEVGIAWNDSDIGVDWRVANPLLSDRDRHNAPLRAQIDALPMYE